MKYMLYYLENTTNEIKQFYGLCWHYTPSSLIINLVDYFHQQTHHRDSGLACG